MNNKSKLWQKYMDACEYIQYLKLVLSLVSVICVIMTIGFAVVCWLVTSGRL